MRKTERGTDRRISSTDSTFPLKLDNAEVTHQDCRSNSDRRRYGFISEQTLFDGVPYSVAEPLIDLCDELNLDPSEVLLEPDQENHTLYLLLEGQLKVYIDNLDSEEGFLIKPGECIGEVSIIDSHCTTAYVVAETPSRILAIPEVIFWQEFFKLRLIARNFLRMVSQRFRQRNHAMQQILEHQLRLEHLHRELAIAHDIQASMLATDKSLWSHFPNVDIEVRMTAANEVGGDFYDVLPLSDNKLCLAIGDVSGKGVPAALFMVRSMTLLREEMLKQKDLPAALQHLNENLCKDNPRCMFTTLIVGILDIETWQFDYINAGHNRPLYAPDDGNYEYLEATSGILVGINEDATYQSVTQQMAPGEALVLYTDGVTEAMNPCAELFSDARLRSLLSTEKPADAKQVVETIVTAVSEFVGDAPQSDDLTLVVLRISTPQLVTDE